MWTRVRYALHGDDARRAREGAELLRRAGFATCGGGDACTGVAVADVAQDPAVVAREIFVALAEAGLHPVWVSGAHLGAPRAREAAAAGAP
jgi:hypothetical protein